MVDRGVPRGRRQCGARQGDGRTSEYGRHAGARGENAVV